MRDSENKDKVGIIYVRVSTRIQAKEGYSLDSAIDELTSKAGEHKIKLLYDPVIDVVSTKEHISSKLTKILELAEKGDITHLLVIRLDRIGRNAVESLYFIYRLRELGVKIVTRDGEVDVHDIQDLCRAALECLFATIEIRNLADRTQMGKERSFRNKNWNKPVPFGYTKDGNWISTLPDYEPIIKEIYTLFQNGDSYSRMCSYINAKYKQNLDRPLKTDLLKRILSDPVYIGRPQYRNAVVEDPELKHIDEETFNKTQQHLKEKNKKNKKDKKVISAEALVKEFGMHYAQESLPIAILCDNCGKPMERTNGPREINGIYRNNYLCECGRQRTIPTAHQLDQFYSAKPFYCPNCGTPDTLDEEKDGEWFKVTCNTCGYAFNTDRSINKFLRHAKKRKTGRKISVSDDSLRELSDFFGLEE